VYISYVAGAAEGAAGREPCCSPLR
jgi:hypothetical protein